MSTSAQVLAVLSDESAGYQEVAEELRAGLTSVREGRTRMDVLTAQRLAGVDDAALNAYELVVTIGLSAAQATMARESVLATPPLTLCLLIPRQSFARLSPARTGGRERRVTAVFIDQPLSRQLDLIRLALPDKHRVGVVLGPSSQALKDDLRDRARERALQLKIAEVAETSGVYGALQRVLPESDLLLALPDPVAISSSTVYGLLLTSYRAQVPVVGFSEGLVKAGALMSLFSTARQQGKQGAEIGSRVLGGEAGLPAPQYPRYFTVRVNASVARSLGLRMTDEEALASMLASWGEPAGDALRAHAISGAATPKAGP